MNDLQLNEHLEIFYWYFTGMLQINILEKNLSSY